VSSLAARRRFTLFGAERAVRRQLWKELKAAAGHETMAAAIADEVTDYVQRLAALAEDCPTLPRVFPALRRLIAVPRVLCNAETYENIRDRFGPLAELATLAGGPALREFFYRELLTQLDAALLMAAPSPHRPMTARNEWLIVGFDRSFVWTPPILGGGEWHGHYFVYESRTHRLNRRTGHELSGACDTLQRHVRELTRDQRNEIIRAARLRPGTRLACAT
jgi:hypothetical protein